MFFLFQRHPTDKAYFIAKEILMTERTYKKDLEVINLVIYRNDFQLFYTYLCPLLSGSEMRSAKRTTCQRRLSPFSSLTLILSTNSTQLS